METVKCEYCGKNLPKEDAVFFENEGIYVCKDCVDEHFVECDRCGELIDADMASQTSYGYLCDCCHDDLFG